MTKPLQTYEHGEVRVTFDPNRCIHAAECLRRLPAVFDVRARPWVRPDQAETAAIVQAVHQCPSGALRVAVNDAVVEIAEDDVRVRATRNGPLYVRGAAVVATESGDVLLDDRRCALCRCGASARKPFCDGSHRTIGFRDPQ